MAQHNTRRQEHWAPSLQNQLTTHRIGGVKLILAAVTIIHTRTEQFTSSQAHRPTPGSETQRARGDICIIHVFNVPLDTLLQNAVRRRANPLHAVLISAVSSQRANSLQNMSTHIHWQDITTAAAAAAAAAAETAIYSGHTAILSAEPRHSALSSTTTDRQQPGNNTQHRSRGLVAPHNNI